MGRNELALDIRRNPAPVADHYALRPGPVTDVSTVLPGADRPAGAGSLATFRANGTNFWAALSRARPSFPHKSISRARPSKEIVRVRASFVPPQMSHVTVTVV